MQSVLSAPQISRPRFAPKWPGLGWFQAWRRRRRYLSLRDLDPRLLDDMGVTRGEVELAATLPMHRNASLELHKMAHARRAMLM